VWPSASSSGRTRGPSTVTQDGGGGGKQGAQEDGRRPPPADGRGRRPDSSSSGTPATLSSIAIADVAHLPLACELGRRDDMRCADLGGEEGGEDEGGEPVGAGEERRILVAPCAGEREMERD
jgi:hypothetical protein